MYKQHISQRRGAIYFSKIPLVTFQVSEVADQ